MAEYDNTDKGAAFKPFETQRLILQGKINDEGNERKVVLIKDATKSGTQVIEVFEKVGTLFVNEKRESENAPDYTGPLNGVNKERRLAAWKRSKDGNPYMTFAISDKMSKAPEISKPSFDDDIIPF